MAASLRAADVQAYGVSKTRRYMQTSASAPALLPTKAFVFVDYVVAATPSSVTRVELYAPSGIFSFNSGSSTYFKSGEFNTQSAMDAQFPEQYYFHYITTANQGTRNPSLYHAANVYPPVPQVTNFSATQNIDRTQPLTLTWNAFTGADTQYDFIQLAVWKLDGTRLWSTPDGGQPGALTGTATQATIPANTLLAGQTYSLTLNFTNVQEVNLLEYNDGVPILFQSANVPGITTSSSNTEITITIPGSTPALTGAVVSGGNLQLTWNADIGRVYDLRSSPDLLNWTRVTLITATQATETYTLTPPVGAQALFYRLQPP
ncbi:MAG: hypothetical protein JNG86_11940 [Verrucomicrobiaceae bacterium]|nr:hypothetical protein [Verrucomicrobiaceae bacterium]